MSLQAMSLVLDFAPAHWSSGRRMVALALADRVSSENQECWSSIGDLAARSGLAKRMVRYHIAALAEEGVIERQDRFRENGSQQSNLWIWLWTICGHLQGGCNGVHQGGAVDSTPPREEKCNGLHPLNPTTNPQMNPRGSDG